MKIVDWELADVGDPCWDAGAVFQCHLSFWIKSMPADPGLSPDERVAAARHPLAAMRPAIRSFWRSYLDAQGVADAAGRRLLEQSVRAAGARMIQTAFEAMYAAPRITPAALTMLQVSLNVLTRPQEAIETLLGLPTGPVVRRISDRPRPARAAVSPS